MYLGTPDAEVSEVVVRVVDAEGRELAPDPFSWSPVFPTSLVTWLERSLPRLSPSEREAALKYLLERAEQRRIERLAGKRIGAARWLGVFAAPPDWGLYRRGAPSPSPYRSLRVYRTRWRPSHPQKTRTLLASYDAAR